jgi:hypothetical protein
MAATPFPGQASIIVAATLRGLLPPKNRRRRIRQLRNSACGAFMAGPML